jgi:hypothetical protein
MFKKKEKIKLYRVTFREVDNLETETKIMDGRSLAVLDVDWAFVIEEVEEL